MGVACHTHGRNKKAHKVLVGTPEKGQFGRYKCRWDNNMKMDLKRNSVIVDWILLAQERDQWWALMNMIMNLWVP
jgi:hypothetical protein